MNKLDEARNKINQIDQEMISLFKQRMQAVFEVAEYKKNHKLDVVDSSREQTLLVKNLSILDDKNLEEYYQIFFDGVLKASKAYQKDLIK